MKPSRAEGIALGVVNIGLAMLTGLWLGFVAFLIAFVVFYTIIGLSHGYYDDVSIWNWFLDVVDVSLPFKSDD